MDLRREQANKSHTHACRSCIPALTIFQIPCAFCYTAMLESSAKLLTHACVPCLSSLFLGPTSRTPAQGFSPACRKRSRNVMAWCTQVHALGLLRCSPLFALRKCGIPRTLPSFRTTSAACHHFDSCGVQLMEQILHMFKRVCARPIHICDGPSYPPSLILGHGKHPSHPPVVWKKSCMSESPPRRRPTLMIGGPRGAATISVTSNIPSQTARQRVATCKIVSINRWVD